ncbi:hypothetical protein C7R94_01260 [Brevibacillus sp. NRRL NRS-603]|nr:hypothetical protein [Brevibacillus formosus]PSK21331.1 hypothetical protein C7R94_01260 [Brevibacillus sp. NRRL NRS-603]
MPGSVSPEETESKLDVKLSLIQMVTRHPQSKTVVIPSSKHIDSDRYAYSDKHGNTGVSKRVGV